jgi:GT2 family glycosyltransferase
MEYTKTVMTEATNTIPEFSNGASPLPKTESDIGNGPGPTASIVIVSFNGRELLPACLEPTLAQATQHRAEVIVVDNGSTDGSVDLLRETYPAVRLIEATHNLGFAGGCNAGCRAAASNTIILLNNDAVPELGWLSGLIDALDEPNVAVACSVIHERDYPEAYALGTGALSVIGHPIAGAMQRPERPFFATGCSLAFKRSVCGDPFDPIFFTYYEDVFLAWRVRLQGFVVARALGSHVQHLGSITAQRNPARAFSFRERNKLVTLLLCYQRSTLLRLLPLYAFDGLVRLGEDLVRAVRAMPSGQAGAPAFVAKYAVLLKALGWIMVHASTIAQRRAAIQQQRRVDDAAITPLLSAKIFDDVVPSRSHAIANRVARLYCRLASIRTVEGPPLLIRHDWRNLD